MGLGINIPFIADVARWLKGTNSVTDSLDDVSDALTDLARDSIKSADAAGDALEAGIENGAKDAGTAVEKLEDDVRAAMRQVAQRSRDAGDDLGDNVRRGARDADEGVKSLKENTAQNAKEMGASFNDVTSALDAVQGLAAEALEGFGPAGVAAGVAVAAGIGIASVALQDAADKANELTQEAIDFADEMSSTETIADRVSVLRDRWREVATSIADARSLWEIWQPRAITNIERFAEAARDGSVDIHALYDAFNEPDPTARLAKLNSALEGVKTQLRETTNERRLYGTGIDMIDALTDDHVKELNRQTDAIITVRDALTDTIAQEEAAASVTRALADAEGLTVAAYEAKVKATETATATQEAYSAALEATAEPVNVYGQLLADKTAAEQAAAQATADKTADQKDSWEDYAKSVTVTIDDMIAELDRQIAAAAAFDDNLAKIAAAGGQALADELRAKGPEVAGATADLIANASPDKQAQYIEKYATATGRSIADRTAAGVSSQASGIQDAIRTAVNGVGVLKVPVTADTTSLDRLLGTLRTVPINFAVRGGSAVG